MKVVGLAMAALLVHVASLAAETGERPLTREEIAAGVFILRSPRLAATLMVPDEAASPYDGVRFESGGTVTQVTLDGRHTFIGSEGLTNRRGGIGLMGELGILAAIGYEDARPGDRFLKPGVGLLLRDDDPKYRFWIPYPVALRLRWQVSVGPLAATFVQVCGPFRGTAYRYTKRVVLDPALPVLRIESTLANIGDDPITTDHYCHNFLRFDDAPPGPDYVLSADFPWKVKEGACPYAVAEREVRLKEAVAKDALYARFVNQDAAARSHTLTVRHAGNGRELVIRGNFPALYFAYYVDRFALSPEAFCSIRVAPGATFQWTRTYEFK